MSKKPPKKPRSGVDGISGNRSLHVRVKTAKKRSAASARWLERQLNDPFVQQAKRDGYRSRAAYKLTEMDDKFGLLKPGYHVVDLGAAPGGWLQVAAERTKADAGSGSHIVGIDLLDIPEVPHTLFMQGDFMDDDAPEKLIAMLGGEKAHLVMSDMAPNTTGHAATDHLRIVMLCEAAFYFARDVLRPGGGFVAKTWQGGAENQLLAEMKQCFTSVKHAKPKASRADSAEMYVVATGFKG